MLATSGRMHLSERRVRSEGTPVGINVAIGVAAMLTGVLIAALMPGSVGWWRMAPVALALIVTGASTSDVVATGFVAGVTFLAVTGFLVNRYGQLSWHGMTDTYRLVVLLGAAGLGLAAGAAWRGLHARRPLVVPAGWVLRPETLMRTNKEEALGG